MSRPEVSPPSVSDLLTDQFYQWELRGRGWLTEDAPIELEPPFRPFEGHIIPREFFHDDGIQETGLSRFADKFLRFLGKPPERLLQRPDEEEIEEPAPQYLEDRSRLVELQVQLPKTYQPTREVMAQCLSSLSYCRRSLGFEVVGTKAGISTQLVAELSDAEQVFPQIKAHFPDAVINPNKGSLMEAWGNRAQGASEIREFGLRREFMLQLQTAGELAVDPLVGICGALEMLSDKETGVFQVLFQPVRHPWEGQIWNAVTTDGGNSFFSDFKELPRQTERKLSHPLYAVVVRIGARSSNETAVWSLIKRLAGALHPFSKPGGNELILLENDSYAYDEHEFDLLNRCSRRYGMLLNSDELVSLAHLPTAAVRSRKLQRAVKRSKEAPQIATGEGILLGENEHEGRITRITLDPEQRVRHLHMIGASGTGKSTLLLNLICQDIFQGNGVAVLDPHGELIDKVLSYIPPERYQDVILFDPSDELYPIGFNILSAHSELEKNLLASDLVAVFRRLSTSWGDQMTSVLGNAILAFLESSKGGTLADLRRFLTEPPFRKEFLSTVSDSEVHYYWEKEFPMLKSTNSVGPLLTRLNSFLRPKAIRYIVGQRENRLDFRSIMDEGKILLCPLPLGLIGEENAHLLGALLVAKIHQLAVSRQEQEQASRRPYFLYLDEFQHFATPSMAAILSGVRKYNLGLVLAHHELRQIQGNDDLASAVMSHPLTRICFRVGDEDARRLAGGFSYFEASDLQNLSIGEAICRVERVDSDFNLKTILPPEVEDEDAAQRKTYLQYLTREKYGRPREEVERELAEGRSQPSPEKVDPFARRTRNAKQNETPVERRPTESKRPDVEIPAPAPPPSADESSSASSTNKPPVPAAPQLKAVTTKKPKPMPAQLGRGGEHHKHVQAEIKGVAEGFGFQAKTEASIPNTKQSVDVLLKKDDYTVACEYSHTQPIPEEVGNALKCLKAGYTHVAVICDVAEKLDELKAAVLDEVPASEYARLGFYSLAGFIEWFREQAPLHTTTTATVCGYEVTTTTAVSTESERKQREQEAIKVLLQKMRKRRKKRPE